MKSSPASCLLIIKRFIDTAYSAVAALTRFEKTWPLPPALNLSSESYLLRL